MIFKGVNRVQYRCKEYDSGVNSMNKDLIVRARRASLEEYLRGMGESLLKEGRQYRVKKHSGVVVSGNKWYSHTLLKGGNSLDYLIEIERMEFKKAVGILSHVSIAPVILPDAAKTLHVAIPQRNPDDKRAIAYLVKTRGITAKFIIPLLKKGLIYEAANTHNVVFTGIDSTNTIRYVMQRSTISGSSLKFESQDSDKRFSFSLKGQSYTLMVFESPVDLLSFISLKSGIMHDHPHMLSLGGISDIALEAYIEREPGINFIEFLLDNDRAGHEAYLRFRDKYSTRGFHVFMNFPEEKDWNQQLLNNIRHKV
ncbi:MAG: toprim domain-containing protein [Paludibacter sp.]